MQPLQELGQLMTGKIGQNCLDVSVLELDLNTECDDDGDSPKEKRRAGGIEYGCVAESDKFENSYSSWCSRMVEKRFVFADLQLYPYFCSQIAPSVFDTLPPCL